MQLARHKSGKHTSCLAVTRKPVALGPCLTTYSGKIWSISYLGISELLSNPAGCYWKDSSPGGISWTSTFLFNICSFLTISQQSTRAPNFWNTKGRKKKIHAVVWSGAYCVWERMGLRPPSLVTSCFLLAGWRGVSHYTYTHSCPGRRPRLLLGKTGGGALLYSRRTRASYLRMGTCKQMDLCEWGFLFCLFGTTYLILA